MKFFKIFTGALLLCAMANYPSTAQDGKSDAPAHQNFGELRQSFHSWFKQEVLPSMTGWKGQLDRAMTSDDLQMLNSLRARAAALHQQAMTTRKALHEAWKDEDYTALKTHRDAMKQLDEQRKALMEEVKPLAAKYRTTLQEIGTAAQPKMQIWKEQGKQIFTQWREQHKDELKSGMGYHALGNLMGRFGHLRDLPASERKKAMAVWFMLWDGTDRMEGMNGNMSPDHPFDQENTGFAPAPGIRNQTDGLSSSDIALNQNFPNPVRDYATINYTLPEEQEITLTVYDQTGHEVTTLAHGLVSAGEHSVQFDASGLPSGLYIYRLTTPTSSSDHTLCIVK